MRTLPGPLGDYIGKAGDALGVEKRTKGRKSGPLLDPKVAEELLRSL